MLRALGHLFLVPFTFSAFRRSRPRQPLRKLPTTRLWLESLEDRALPSQAGAALVAFDPAQHWLSIVGDAAQVSVASNGALAVTVDGQSAAMPPGIIAADVRGIGLTGAGASDVLTLSNLTAGGDLTVGSDGGITVAGHVTVTGALTVNSAGLLDVETDGSLAGASITAVADQFVNTGLLRADGGSIAISARAYLNAGTISASATAGAGGSVTVAFTASYTDTATALTSASGNAGAGGQVSIDGGSGGRLFSSGQFTATGTTGGNIDLFGENIFLIAATIDASGTAGAGGQVRVGGDEHGGNPSVPNAQAVDVSGTTVLHADGVGAGGRVIVWSETNTAFCGSVSARSSGGGAGGFIEVSSHGQLSFGGTADAGTGGTLLLDPKDLVVSAASTVGFPQYSIVDPNGHGFSAAVVPLSNGNIVAQAGDAGDAYLFDSQTGALLSDLIVGSGQTITVLKNDNYVLAGTGTATGTGTVTWASGTTGISGVVSESNSFIEGGTPTAITVTPLTNGNYVVFFQDWNGGVGAVTWGNGTTGTIGTVSAANSLVGIHLTDGTGGVGDAPYTGPIIALTNGNYVVDSQIWNNYSGAVTWGNGATGTVGTVSAANSLVDAAANDGDRVGMRVTALPNGNYVVDSPQWNNSAGAVTWGNGATGISGAVSATNSLVGTLTGAPGGGGGSVGGGVGLGGLGGVVVLTNGNYVVDSPGWDDPNLGDAGGEGAVTWASALTGISGPVSAANSLIGSVVDDSLGLGGVIALTNGNYVVDSPYCAINFNPGVSGGEVGAVTWGNGVTGTIGVVSPANSLVGSHGQPDQGGLFGDGVGSGGVTALTNGDYVVASPTWNGMVGAVTWCDGTQATIDTVSTGNSLVGSIPGDWVGGGLQTVETSGGYETNVDIGGVTALTNGNYVVESPLWNNTAGAVTWGNGATGTEDTVSADNSLVGTYAGDLVGDLYGGGVTALTNGDYVVASPSWTNSTGAATWGNGAGGTTGAVSSANSLVGGTEGDQVGRDVDNGSDGVTALAQGNYVVLSSNWSDANGSGAATWGSGTKGVSGVVSGANSLIDFPASSSGSMFYVIPIPNGDYFVQREPGGSGPTWVDGGTGSTLDGQNTQDAQNTLAGSLPDAVDTGGVSYDASTVVRLPDGSYVYPAITSGGVESSYLLVVGFTDPNQLTYALGEDQTITVIPDVVTRLLDAGTNVTLQASDDITIDSPITVTPTGSAGSLTLDAGRSIILNASINTAGGNLTLIANDTMADGVVDAERDAGNAAITMASGQPVNVGAGTLSVDLMTSTDKTNNGQGAATLLGLTTGSTALSAATVLGVDLNGTVAGDGSAGTFTQTDVAGPIDLGGATLQVSSQGGFAIGQQFVIVQSTQPIVGTFANLSEGSSFDAAGQTLKISYLNNQVTLTALTGVGITPASLANGLVGASTSQQLTANGGVAPYTFAVSAGALPAGLSLSSAGLIDGTPTAGGTFNFTVTATDSAGHTGSQSYALTIAAATIVLSPTSLPAPAGGAVYNQTVSASGGTAPYAFSVTSGSLPGGLSLSTDGTLSGTPTAGGSFTFTVGATDSSTGTGPYSGSHQYTFTVNPIALSPASLNAATVGVAYNQTVSAAGGSAPYTFSITAGNLPAGLSLSSNGVLSGTPTAGGSFSFTVQATDAASNIGTQGYDLTVAAPNIAVSPTSLAAAVVGVAYNQSVSASGGISPYTFTIGVGNLPAGLSLSSSGTLSGTPTAGGSFTFTVAAKDSGTGSGPFTGTEQYTLTVASPKIAVSPATLPDPEQTLSYSQTLTAAGGTAPYKNFTVSSGSLPAGLSLDAATGTISGTPTALGTFTFTVSVTDSSTGSGPYTGSQQITLTVAPPIFIYDAATKTLTIAANATTNTLSYSQATTQDAAGLHTTYTFTVDGVTQSYTDAQVTSVTATAQGTPSSNTATLITNDTYIGTDGQTHETAESIQSGPGGGTIYKTDANGNVVAFLQLSGFGNSYAYVGRADSAQLRGVAGSGIENVFVTAGTYSYVVGAGEFHLISGAAAVYGYTVNPTDQDWQYDAAGSLDAFVASGNAFNYMSGSDSNGNSFFNVGVGFQVSYGISTHGDAIAYLIDSPGNDTFVGNTTVSYLSGSDSTGAVFNVAEAFALVYAESFVGGTDFAYNYDPAHNILNSAWILLT